MGLYTENHTINSYAILIDFKEVMGFQADINFCPVGLKILRWQLHVGSIPSAGTNKKIG